ncbi:MAG: aminoacyl-tRNA hydrolase, partial [Opitutales bacterium]|nr:aminoacyl-tRNA hydrolase [Opitutales bacterium]
MESFLRISPTIRIPLAEIQWQAVRAQGPGGQNVNKVSSAVQIFFPIRESSLPEEVKQSLLRRADQRISTEGVLIIKAKAHRTQEKNYREALQRLQSLLEKAIHKPKKRHSTKP